MLGTLNDRGLICKRPALPAVAFPSPTGRLGRNPCRPRAGRRPSTKPASVRHLAAYITEPHESTLHLRCSSGITPPRLPCLGRAPPCPSRRGGPHALLACHAQTITLHPGSSRAVRARRPATGCALGARRRLACRQQSTPPPRPAACGPCRAHLFRAPPRVRRPNANDMRPHRRGHGHGDAGCAGRSVPRGGRRAFDAAHAAHPHYPAQLWGHGSLDLDLGRITA